MTNVFDQAMKSLFSDPNLAVTVSFSPKDGGEEKQIRACRKNPDVIEGIEGFNIVKAQNLIEIFCSDVSNPQIGDLIKIGGETLKIKAPPRKDNLGIFWLLECV